MTPRERVKEAGAHTTQAELLELLDHADADQTHIIALLRKRELPSALIETVARHERWSRRQVVRAAIVNHQSTPRTLALRMLQLLFWKDQLKVAVNFRLATPLRTAAENRLKERLPELEAGERISLARQAPPGLLPLLAADGDPRVIRALLVNPRLREREVVVLVETPTTASGVLAAVGTNDRWVNRPAILKGVVSHKNTPVHVALTLLRRFSRRDLQRLLMERPLPRLVQIGAERILES